MSVNVRRNPSRPDPQCGENSTLPVARVRFGSLVSAGGKAEKLASNSRVELAGDQTDQTLIVSIPDWGAGVAQSWSRYTRLFYALRAIPPPELIPALLVSR